MATYKTPGVYVEEIPVLPASVAQVATAVPAFIGYTERAIKDGQNVELVPTRLESLPEFREAFGGPPSNEQYNAYLDASFNVTRVEVAPRFFLYDSLQSYFDNGGGACYVVSVGSFQQNVGLLPLTEGLKTLERVDEPTLILSPDASLLSAEELALLQVATLAQCAKLKDRFGVFDLKEDPIKADTAAWQAGRDAFRNNIGVNNLKYGAAYTPWIKVQHPKRVGFENLELWKSGSRLSLRDLTTDPATVSRVAAIETAISDRDEIASDILALGKTQPSVEARYESLVKALNTAATAEVGASSAFSAVFDCLLEIAATCGQWAAGTGSVAGEALRAELANVVTTSLVPVVRTLIGYHRGATGGANLALPDLELDPFAGPVWAGAAEDDSADVSIYQEPAGQYPDSEAERILAAMPAMTVQFNRILAAIVTAQQTSQALIAEAESALLDAFPKYKALLEAVRKQPTRIPPSGAIAGVYASVDRTRGVWKAPANVSLAGVIGLSEQITEEQQMDLNVDVVAGKSINAIRYFTGKGNLVWGARTLAGNDSEWRFVSVRRFFNMVEESLQKATAWAVFEPNDPNTWVRLKGMLDNYLTGLWRDGALAGAKPEQAFFVSLGLGRTMTPADILEGRLIIEVGMAVVRPAEFIVLRFMHKLQSA